MSSPIKSIPIQAILISFFIFILYIFQPYSILDHSKTTVICANKVSYKLGENFIYLFSHPNQPEATHKLNSFCGSHNYQLIAEYDLVGGYLEGLLIIFIIFTLIRKFFGRIDKFIIISGTLGLILFFIFLKSTARQLYCERQMASSLANFKKSAYGFGWLKFQTEKDKLNKSITQAYQNCLIRKE